MLKKEFGSLYENKSIDSRSIMINELLRKVSESGFDSMSLYYDGYFWSNKRSKLHDKLINKMMDKYKNVPNDGQVLLSGGLPGAGKSTIIESMSDFSQENYATISSDDFKMMLIDEARDFEDIGLLPNETATLYHEESAYLADLFLAKLTKENKNCIYDFTFKDPVKAEERINIFKTAGYKDENIGIIFVDIDVDTAKDRAKKRFSDGLNDSLKNNSKGGRYTPIDFIDQQKPIGHIQKSINAESIIEVYNNPNLNIKNPIIYNNSGNMAVKVDFDDFIKGE